MSTEPRDLYFQSLKRVFAPALREMGFKGSGQNFRRQREDAIHAVNIQGDPYGGRACVNLGLHFTCLPHSYKPDFPKLAEWREVDCEFRCRLAHVGRSDHWWAYRPTPEENDATTREMVALFHTRAEPLFARTPNAASFAASVPLSTLTDPGCPVHAARPWDSLDVRLALALARIRAHEGDAPAAKAYAEFGLRRIVGHAGVALRPTLLALAGRA